MFSFSKQPLPVLKVISEGFKLFSHTFSKIWYWSFLFQLINSVPNLYSFFKNQPMDKNSLSAPDILFLLLALFIQVYASVFLTHRIYGIAAQPDSKTADSLKVAKDKWMPALLAIAITGLLLGAILLCLIAVALKIDMVVGLVVFGPPLIFLSLLLIFYLPCIIFNNESGFESLKKSASLVWGHWWQTALVVILPILIGLVLLVFAMTIQTQNSLGFILSTTVISTITTPLMYALILTQFNNLQLSKGGKGL